MSCHQLQYLPLADQIVVLDNQTIGGVGSYTELQAKMVGTPHEDLFSQQHGNNDTELPVLYSGDEVEDEEAVEDDGEKPGRAVVSDPGAEVGAKDSQAAESAAAPASKKDELAEQLMTAEERKSGKVELAVYLDYAQQFGSIMFLLVVFWFAMAQCSQVTSDWWMGRWSEDDTTVIFGYRASWSRNHVLNYFLVGYGLLALVQVSFAAIKVVFVQLAGLRAARAVHERILARLLGAPTSFFDVTPVRLGSIGYDPDLLRELGCEHSQV
eukprot:SAG22_NODE_44_length_24912_cov_33.648894_23_plen_268_part_00